ncbi:MAG: dienelactone hydrolase family protein [Myxococcales bacterium]
MELTTKTIELPGQMNGFLARPTRAGSPLPGVLVIQEIWGVDGHIQDVAGRLATAGYVALAPDLFSKGGGRPAVLAEKRVEAAKRFLDTVPPQNLAALMNPSQRDQELERLPKAERRSVGETLGQLFSPERMSRSGEYVQDILTSAQWLRAQPFCKGRLLGAVGFCMGGGLAAALATEDGALGASVCYYGAPPPAENIPRIHCPVLALYGEDDPRLMPSLPPFEQAMKKVGKELDLHVYPKTPHAFFNDTRASYRVEAARDAWARTLSLFARALSPAA